MSEKIFVTLCILFTAYLSVLFAIFADLWAGVRKAKQNHVARSSYGYRRTIDKIAKYYNALIALTIIDAMQMVSVWYLEMYYEYHIPLFPFITIGGAICIGLVEIKSIYEKAEDKVRIDDVATLLWRLVAHRKDIGEVSKDIVEYIKEPSEEKKKEENQ